MSDLPIPFRPRYPRGFLRNPPPLRTLAQAEAEIAAARADDRMNHLRPYAPSLGRPKAQLLRPLSDAPLPRRPTIKPMPKRSWLGRLLFGRLR